MSKINLNDIKLDLDNQILMTIDRSQRDPDNTIVTKVLFEVHPGQMNHKITTTVLLHLKTYDYSQK